MRADVFQAIALCCHSNAYLSDQVDTAPELLANSTFSTVHEVLFRRLGAGKLATGIVADAPAPWLRRLKKEGVTRLGLSLASCPFDLTKPSDEPWGILSDGDVGLEVWEPTWRKRIRGHSDPSPWFVEYSSKRTIRATVHSAFSIEDSERLLTSAIRHASSAHPLLATLLVNPAPFGDLYPEGWPEQLRKLAALAAKSVALMRSPTWSEVLLDKEMGTTDYEIVSQKIWKAALMALETASLCESAASAHPTIHNFPLAG